MAKLNRMLYDDYSKSDLLYALENEEQRKQILSTLYPEVLRMFSIVFHGNMKNEKGMFFQLFKSQRTTKYDEKIAGIVHEGLITLIEHILAGKFEGGTGKTKPINALKAYWLSICEWKHWGNERKRYTNSSVQGKKGDDDERIYQMREEYIEDLANLEVSAFSNSLETSMDLKAAYQQLGEVCQKIIDKFFYQGFEYDEALTDKTFIEAVMRKKDGITAQHLRQKKSDCIMEMKKFFHLKK